MSDETQVEEVQVETPVETPAQEDVQVENDGEFPEGHEDNYVPASAEDDEDDTDTEDVTTDVVSYDYDLIVGTTLDGWIGDPRGRLPFRQSGDLKNFKALTSGHVVIMGRKTLESIGTLLPNRLNVIMTKNPIKVDTWLEDGDGVGAEDKRNGASRPLIVASFEELERRLPEYVQENQKLFIIGGDSFYKQALVELNVQRIWQTVVQTTLADANVEAGWARFDVPANYVEISERGTYPADEKNQYPYLFRTLAKKA